MNHEGAWDELAYRWGTDKSSTHHGYMKHYEEILGPRADSIRTLLELGVAQYGRSLHLWHQLLPAATIVGVDFEMSFALEQRPGLLIEVADVTDPAKLCAISTLYGPWDVVIDDASHDHDDVRVAFEELYPRVSAGGVYFVEDLMPDTEFVREYFVHHRGARVIDGLNNLGCLIVVEKP